MKYARVIVNPAAGAGGTAKRWPQIMDLLESTELGFEYDLTEGPGHATELAKSAVKNGYSLVVSVGGDGTINEIVNGLYDAACIDDVALGIISTGTGGDYIRTLGIPRSHEQACHGFINPKKLTVDLGVMEYTSEGKEIKRLFVNFAGLGFDAEVVKATTQKFKALGSTTSYLVGLLSTFLSYTNKEISLTVDGEAEEIRVCTVIMGNGKYGGGGMLTTPDADISDGLFDVLIIEDLTKPDLLRSLPRIYKGTHLTHPKVTLKRAKEVVIQSRQTMSLQADGELLGEAPARFSVLPGVLNVVIPGDS